MVTALSLLSAYVARARTAHGAPPEGCWVFFRGLCLAATGALNSWLSSGVAQDCTEPALADLVTEVTHTRPLSGKKRVGIDSGENGRGGGGEPHQHNMSPKSAEGRRQASKITDGRRGL